MDIPLKHLLKEIPFLCLFLVFFIYMCMYVNMQKKSHEDILSIVNTVF